MGHVYILRIINNKQNCHSLALKGQNTCRIKWQSTTGIAISIKSQAIGLGVGGVGKVSQSVNQSRLIVQSRGGMHGTRLSVTITHLLVHLSAMLTEIFVALHVELDKVAHFHWIDLACAAMANLEDQRTD